ncbi:hypothetical protein [Streptomyces sp. NPDC089919]|uniref:hypothetical protein n=1 Tax=Streptomyces sp. NPDC089919 TaxID=3155188 RepID=UPI003432C6B3
MPRLLRYLLIWLSCTAASITAVMLTVYFVIGLTRPTPPAARSVQAVFPSPSGAVAVGTAASSAAPRPSAPTVPPSPSGPAGRPSPPADPTRSASPPAPRPSPRCTGGPGLHTVPSEGGKVTVKYGRHAVCFVSAVPAPGFRTGTEQRAPDTLVVVFTSDGHRSQITATVTPNAQASVRESRL